MKHIIQLAVNLGWGITSLAQQNPGGRGGAPGGPPAWGARRVPPVTRVLDATAMAN